MPATTALALHRSPEARLAGFRPAALFHGSMGLRSGWGVALFLALLFSARFFLAAAARMSAPPGDYTPGFVLFWEAISTALVVAVTGFMGFVESRPVRSYGLGGRHKMRYALCGWMAGLTCLLLAVGLLVESGSLIVTGLALRRPAFMLGYGLAWFAAFMLVALSEEMVFRGYLQSALTRMLGFWPAACLSSCLFAAMHMFNKGESFGGLLGVLAGGLVFCLMLRLSGSLWLGIGFHAAWDWAQSFLFGTPDSGTMMQGHLLVTRAIGDAHLSGGAAGLEGSLIAAPVFLAGATALSFAMRRWLGGSGDQ